MKVEDQLKVLGKMGLGKKKKTVRKKWTEEHERIVYDLYNKQNLCSGDISTVAGQIGHSVDSVKMKLANIKAVLSGNNKGLSHISKLTIDVVEGK